MKELIEKLKKEHAALLAKVDKLYAFLENFDKAVEKAGIVQVHLLHTQLSAMELYLHTLEERIEDLEAQQALKKSQIEEKVDKPKEKEGELPTNESEVVQKIITTALTGILGEDYAVKICKFKLGNCQ